MEVSSAFWIGFIILIIVLLLLDMFAFHKKGEVINVKKALWLSFFWISLALIFNAGIYFVFGKEPALEFLTAYLIEKSLSVDNLFVFILIFTSFKIIPKYQHGILFWGILGALIFRAIFIFAGIALLERFSWVMYLFGGFLVITGIKMVVDFIREKREEEKKEEKDLNNSWYVKLTRRIIPMTNDVSEPKFFRRIDHKIVATPFFLALLVIEMTDLVFAIDSIPAVLAVSTDMFIVYTSNIFAILGLRSLYFALRGVMDYFYYLRYALSAILLFIGCKMMFNHFAHTYGTEFYIPTTTSLLIITTLIAISIVASIIRSRQSQKSMVMNFHRKEGTV
ncbi:TerC/Alx family metal homeostasis membrane protein [Proteiniphilum sp.]|uniref:TerC/Alx family metal homeostasis membrane protein n=1 Tax=Proteiniphilum sp. TaxID=1926877 RepID=UPI002B1FD216|nr:TerC/Alx family metal homeostasis membrane protein [Proteiniphilum sp.]MEA4918320.1 TerC/Alx family metal homeostasis membrane protein [Proteiniphilum sp.]